MQFLPLDMPYYGLLALLQTFGLPRSVAQVIVLASILSLAGVAMCALLLRYLQSGVGAAAGAVVYMLNPYVLIEWHDGNPIQLIAYSLAPLVVLLVSILMEERNVAPKHWCLVIVLALALASPSSNPLTVVGCVVLPVVAFVTIRLFNRRDKEIPGRTVFRRLSAACAIAIGVNMWWLLPGAVGLPTFSSAIGQQNYTANPPELVTHVNPLDTLRGLGFWGWRQGSRGQLYFPFEPSYNSVFMIVLTLIPLALAIGTALMGRRVSRLLGWTGILCAALGLLLSEGFHGPFDVYLWLYRHLPDAGVLRSPWERFSGLMWFGIALLIGLAVPPVLARSRKVGLRRSGHGHSRASRTRLKALVPSLLAASIVGVMTGICFPMFGNFLGSTWNYGNGQSFQYYGRDAPVYVATYAKAVQRPDCEVFIPQWEGGGYVAFPWYRGGADNFQALFSCRLLTGSSDPVNDGERLADALDEAMQDGIDPIVVVNFLRSLGVTDILVPFDYGYALYGAGPSPSSVATYFQKVGSIPMRSYGPWLNFALGDHIEKNALWGDGRALLTKDFLGLSQSEFEGALEATYSDLGTRPPVVVVDLGRISGLDTTIPSLLGSPGVLGRSGPVVWGTATQHALGVLSNGSAREIRSQSTAVPTSFVSQGSTARVTIHGASVAFSSVAFDSGWSLEVDPVGRSAVPTLRHVEVNGFANGWIVTGDGSYTESIKYEGVSLIRYGVVVGAFTIVLVLATTYLERRRSVRASRQSQQTGIS